jgi:hypothetical protein
LMFEQDPTQDDLFTNYCDSESNWGPLVVFRPARHERIGIRRALTMSVLLGSIFGIAGNVVLLLAGRFLHRPVLSPWVLPAVLTGVYFLVGRLTFVPAWNRRAARLSRLSKR